MSGQRSSRALLIGAGVLTELAAAACLVLALAALPVAHDLRAGTAGVIATAVAAIVALVCGPLVWRGRLVPLALAAGLDLGLGISLPRGGSAIAALLRILPADELHAAETLVTITSILLFVAAALCTVAMPISLAFRRSAPAQIDVPSAASTLPGIGAAGPSRTQVVRTDSPARNRPLVIASIALTVIALGIVVLTALAGGDGSAGNTVSAAPAAGSSSTRIGAGSVADLSHVGLPPDAASLDAPAEPPPLDAFTARLHAALASASAADLAPLFDDHAFAFGVGAHELAEGRDAVVAQLRAQLGEPPPEGFAVTSRFSHVAHEGDVGWLAEQLTVGGDPFVVSAVLSARDGAWSIAALHWARAMPNPTAYQLAREGELAVPDAIPDVHDESPLASAMRAAFASRSAFLSALDARDDAFNFGSAGERLFGGAAIRKVFGRMRAVLHLHDAVKVGRLGTHGGWGVANVEFTDADRDGTDVTQTFRVLTAWLEHDGAWHIVQAHWSNAR